MDINERRYIDANKCTDIILLTYIALSHTYDLQRCLENIGAFKHENKKAVNRALFLLNSLFTDMDDSLRSSNVYKDDMPKLLDHFSSMVDEYIGLEGVEREMNIISFCCERAYRYCKEVMISHTLNLKVPIIGKEIIKVPAILHPFTYEKYDLDFIFNQQLKNLYGERNYQ